MEKQNKQVQIQKSVQNKTLTDIIKNYPYFVQQITQNVKKLEPPVPFLAQDENKIVEGNDISVCVRIRPLLDHEIQNQHFQCVVSHNPQAIMYTPKLDVKKDPKIDPQIFDLDYTFGPADSNDTVYKVTALPLVDLGLNGGVSSMFAYGQTGSGKTFTIMGIMERIGFDLFARQQKKHFNENKKSVLKIYASFFELLGHESCDLLNENNNVQVLEDKFGKVQFLNLQEVEVTSPDQFIKLFKSAFEHRQTQTTFKNETSSRSHAICKIRIQNTYLKETEDGEIFLIDLAGSENSKDSQFHDKQLLQQTQQINTSLMSLKECIRNRALASQNLAQFIHVPYRTSKLTLILKDSFEMESMRLCKTVVFANVSPSCADVSQTINTLRYAAAIKIPPPPKKQLSENQLKIDPNNPATWTNKELKQWVFDKSNKTINPDTFCPFESGMQILRLPETEVLTRLMKNSGMTEKKAKQFYLKLWGLLIDARTQERKKKLEKKDKRSQQQKDDEYAQELLGRMKEESKGKSNMQIEEQHNQEFNCIFRNNKKPGDRK